MAYGSIVAELERAIESRDAQRRTAALTGVADLFRNAKIQNEDDERLELFDDVFAQLVRDMTISTLAKLSGDLSAAKVAPVKLVQQLAQNDSVEVARPILVNSSQVSQETLVHVACTKGEEHLQAVASRPNVSEAVSDVLIERGSEQVIQTVTANVTAKISERGFGSLTERFSGHEKIALNISRRQDVPPRVMKALLSRATDAVRASILNSAPPGTRKILSGLLNECLESGEVQQIASSVSLAARKDVAAVKAKGKLNEDVLLGYASKGLFGETVVALAFMAALPVETVEQQMLIDRVDSIVIMCRSIGLKWATVAAILSARESPPTPARLAAAKTDYLMLSVENAMRAMRFFYAKQSILRH